MLLTLLLQTFSLDTSRPSSSGRVGPCHRRKLPVKGNFFSVTSDKMKKSEHLFWKHADKHNNGAYSSHQSQSWTNVDGCWDDVELPSLWTTAEIQQMCFVLVFVDAVFLITKTILKSLEFKGMCPFLKMSLDVMLWLTLCLFFPS